MLRVLIVDDEPPARRRLARLLDELPGCEVAGEAGNGSEALELLDELAPVVLLLDISMPGLDGMQLAKRLQRMEHPPGVVFCTAHPDQALRAFDRDAVDYLVKPVRRERLRNALDKAARYVGVDADAPVYLRSTVGGRETLIPVEEVLCLVAEDKYTTVTHAEGRSVINNSLVELEERFPERFVRVHRNALVATERVRGLERVPGGGHRVLLDGTEEKPEVSRRQVAALRKLIRQRL